LKLRELKALGFLRMNRERLITFKLKPAEAENVSASHDPTIGEFRVGGLKK